MQVRRRQSGGGKFWQFCSLSESRIQTAGNVFTVTARNGATLQGTVLHPAGKPAFKVGARPQRG